MPYALIVFAFGLLMAATVVPRSESNDDLHIGFWHPTTLLPNGEAWKTGAIEASIPQLPLTVLNSILAVTSLATTLFPDYPAAPSTTSLGFSIAISNLIGCWFGAMPICHGSGGLAGQYRFGARSGASIIILGAVKLLLGLFIGEGIVPLLQRLPKSLLGIMVFAAGVELAKVGQSVNEGKGIWEVAEEDNQDALVPTARRKGREEVEKERFLVMLITAAGCLAFRNDAIGFMMGLLWHWGLKAPEVWEKVKNGRGSIRLKRDSDHHGEGLLDLRQDEE
jgi:hypothetical protein